jgi:hypothetical protein
VDPRLDLGGRYPCRAAVAARSVSVAVRARAQPDYGQSHAKTAKAPDNDAMPCDRTRALDAPDPCGSDTLGKRGRRSRLHVNI